MKKLLLVGLLIVIVGLCFCSKVAGASPLPQSFLSFPEVEKEVLWFRHEPAIGPIPEKTVLEGRESDSLFVLNLAAYKLYFFPLGQTGLKEPYDLAIGKPSSSSPVGRFRVLEKDVNPYWNLPGWGSAAGGSMGNPLGWRWFGLEVYWPSGGRRNVGIHGNSHNQGDSSILTSVSLSCIRMRNGDIENKLFDATPDPNVVKWYADVRYSTVEVWETPNYIEVALYPDVYDRDADLRFKKLAHILSRAEQKGYTVVWDIDMSVFNSVDAEAGAYSKKVIRVAEKMPPEKPESLRFPKGNWKR